MAFARMVPFYAQVHGATRPTLQLWIGGGGARNRETLFLWMVPFYADTGP